MDSDFSPAKKKLFNMNHYNGTIVRDEFSNLDDCCVYRIPFTLDYLCLAHIILLFKGYKEIFVFRVSQKCNLIVNFLNSYCRKFYFGCERVNRSPCPLGSLF
jgi:hypothetical protein